MHALPLTLEQLQKVSSWTLRGPKPAESCTICKVILRGRCPCLKQILDSKRESGICPRGDFGLKKAE